MKYFMETPREAEAMNQNNSLKGGGRVLLYGVALTSVAMARLIGYVTENYPTAEMMQSVEEEQAAKNGAIRRVFAYSTPHEEKGIHSGRIGHSGTFGAGSSVQFRRTQRDARLARSETQDHAAVHARREEESD